MLSPSEMFVVDVLREANDQGVPFASTKFGVTAEQIARWKLRYFGVSPEHLRPFTWIQICLQTQMEWPTADTAISFEGQQFLLRPATKCAIPDMVAEYDPARFDLDQLHARARRLMSVLSWLKKKGIRETVVARSTALPDRVGPAPAIQNCTDQFEFRFVPRLDSKSSFALALYREALNSNLTSFRFLGYWKLLSLIFKDGTPEQKSWLEMTLSQCTSRSSSNRLRQLRDFHANDKEVVLHLYKSRRCAVAHATGMDINPDNPIELDEVDSDVPLIKEIAEIVIENELKVETEAMLYAAADLMPPAPANKLQALAFEPWGQHSWNASNIMP